MLSASSSQTLSRLADTIVAGLGFEVAVVNLVEADGSLRVAAVAGPASTRELLLGARQSAASWDLLLNSSESWGSLRFLDHRTAPEDPEDLLMWVPDLEASEDPEDWHPYDALFAPLHDRAGELLGVLSVDLPRDGRRPDGATRAMLEAFAVAAALALEQSRLHERVTVSEQLFRAVFEASPVAIAIAGPDQTLHSVNPGYCRLLGRTPAELIGHNPMEFTCPDDPVGDTGPHHVLAAGERGALERRYLHKDGRLVTARLRLAPLGEGPQSRVLVQVEDITESRRQEQALRFHATHDSLTGLSNRASVMDRLAEALERSATSQELVAVFFCDLDRVKLINDGHGHATGDQYIRAVARRLRSVLRSHDCVGRIGGDEFVVVAEHLTTPTEVLGLAGRLMDAVRQPLQIGTIDLAPSMSLGVAYEVAGTTTTARQLVADADAAMYEAKTHGRGAWRVFNPALRGDPLLHLELRHQIGRAIEQGEFELHYQPIVRLRDGQRVGYEALLRWQHPQHGLLAPGAFLDMIVDSEYEAPVTDWVIQQAAHDAANWPGGSRPFMSVNVSAFQLAREDLPAVVTAALAAQGLDPGRMAIELTEDRCLEAAVGERRLQALRDTGVLISIDDFGTGFAGLGYVQRLPVNTLKIDRSFVAPLPEDAASKDIVAAICHLAQARGLHVVAEGIESAAQLTALMEHGVGFGQGYHLGRPAPLQAHAGDPAAVAWS